jgi:uncharacterized protein
LSSEDRTFSRVVARMSDPSFYSPPPPQVDVRETHVSVVFLVGDRAYKLKKPVRLPFLDYSTLARRRRCCDAEVRLNRRFAPDIYLGVRAISPRGADLGLADPDDGAALEYAVVMRRFDEEATLDRLTARGAADERLAQRVGAAVAELHTAAPRAPAGYWTSAYVGERLRENFDTTRGEVGTLLDRLTFDAVMRFSQAFLRAHDTLLARRIATGKVRDVHGDLRAEHVVIEPAGLSIVDCVDFDDRLRRIDVAADLAFLTMDLERLGALPLAKAVERAYIARTQDVELRALLPFYACYRAWVRAKVNALRIDQLEPGNPALPALQQRARELFALSLRLAWRGRLPLLVAFCGVAGSGKSTLAAELSRRSGLPHLSSDRVRKELAGVPLKTRAPPELYAPEVTARTYRELTARARSALATAGGAIVDATFHRAVLRAPLCALGARVLWVECTAPARTLRSRSSVREHGPEHGSDATWAVASAQLEAWEPLEEIDPAGRVALRTDRPVETCLDELDSFVSASVDMA